MSKFLDLDGFRYFFTKIRTQFDGRYYKQEQVDTMLAGKSDTSHNHDSRYYTETEMDGFLRAKANIASPTFTGQPKAPTFSQGDNSTRIATTEYVDTGLAGKSNTSHNHDTRYYTQASMNSLLQDYPRRSDLATTSANGLMSSADKVYLNQTEVQSIDVSNLTVSAEQVEVNTTNSRIFMFNRRENNAVIIANLTIDILSNQSSGTAIVRDMPRPVGVPCFVIGIKNNTSVVMGYLNDSGGLVINGSLTAGQRVYAHVVYYTKNASHFIGG